ncbi:MAG: hypothetical protein IPM53_00860 [Anaerolineaceae bacterium]|nr:hypothetical protein [Anaerolineaceae bacterium]
MGEWFALLLRLSLVATITRTYHPFDSLGLAALQVTAQKYQLSLNTEDAAAIMQTMRHLPPNSDVIPALAQLQAVGYRLTTLINSSLPSPGFVNQEDDDGEENGRQPKNRFHARIIKSVSGRSNLIGETVDTDSCCGGYSTGLTQSRRR